MPARAEVVVVGAGLAGLAAATRLAAAGCDVHVVEAAEHAGGRLTTERIDGFVVDRGFQVLNTGYPRVADLDLPSLDLGWFLTGARVWVDGRAHAVVDPRSRPAALPATATAPIGSLREKAALAAFSLRAGYLPVPRLLAAPERTAAEALQRAGLGCAVLERFLRPFLAGVLLEDRLDTSSRYLDLLWRSFVRGRIGLPARGMQSVGEQLAGRLPAGALHLGCPVTAVRSGAVDTAAGPIAAVRRRRRHRPDGGRGPAAGRDRLGSTPGHHAPARAARLAVGRAAAGPRPARRAAGEQRRPHRRPAAVRPGRPRPGGQLHARPHPGGRRPRGGRAGARGRRRRPGPPDQRDRAARAAGRRAAAGPAARGRPGRRRVRLR
ncbi:FAD-dependent oxidoreductase [Blastococcus sp. TML/C7B]|nr:FAD-dependent oxidoreductase [Blastococcus sp. TML/C7B]